MDSVFTFLFGGSTVDIAIRIGVIIGIIVAVRYLIGYLWNLESRRKRDVLDRLVSSGNYLQAGNLYLQEGKPVLALKMFTQGGHWDRAAVVHASTGDHTKAAEMYEKAGQAENAAKSWLKVKEYLKAAECMSRCETRSLRTKSAELFESQKEYRRAAEIFTSLSIFDRAAGALKQLGEEKQAHELMGRHFAARGDDLRAAESFANSGNDEKALGHYAVHIKNTPLEAETVETYYQYALVLERVSRPMEAMAVYDQIATFNKNFRDALIRMNKIKRETVGISAIPDDVPVAHAATRLQFASPIQSKRYEVLKEIGRGGMGVVYEAMDTTLGRLVALKVLHESYTQNPVAEKFFLREAQSAAKLNHPNIVTVYDVGTLEDKHFISMEFVEGTTVEDILGARGKIPMGEFTPLAVQILSALAYAHERSVIHRDIKPGNIMVHEGQVKIMDFGLAKVMDDKQKTTVVAGTPQYMSMEQMIGKNVDHRTDIFALGVTFYEMLTTQLPYPDGILAFPPDERPIDLRTVDPSISVKLSKIVHRMIERKTEDRYPTTQDVLKDMKTVAVYAAPR